MRYGHDPRAYSVRHTARGHGIARFLSVIALCGLGIYGLVSHTMRASAEDGRPGYVGPAGAGTSYASYRGHRIYYSHHRRYYLQGDRRHYLPRGRFAS
jgi:hypothetical protein